jgi:hypothetical protein
MGCSSLCNWFSKNKGLADKRRAYVISASMSPGGSGALATSRCCAADKRRVAASLRKHPKNVLDQTSHTDGTTAGIEEWLNSFGPVEYAPRFVENDIDWTNLSELRTGTREDRRRIAGRAKAVESNRRSKRGAGGGLLGAKRTRRVTPHALRSPFRKLPPLERAAARPR